MVPSLLIHHHLVFLPHKLTVSRRPEQCLGGFMEEVTCERKGWKKEKNRIWVKPPHLMILSLNFFLLGMSRKRTRNQNNGALRRQGRGGSMRGKTLVCKSPPAFASVTQRWSGHEVWFNSN